MNLKGENFVPFGLVDPAFGRVVRIRYLAPRFDPVTGGPESTLSGRSARIAEARRDPAGLMAKSRL